MSAKLRPIAFCVEAKNSRMYYNSRDLLNYDPIFYYGCKTRPRSIIQKKNIPDTDYIYSVLRSKEWRLTNADCKKSQLLISKTWVDKYFFGINERQVVKSVLLENPMINNIENKDINMEQDVNFKMEEDVNIQDDIQDVNIQDDIEEAPPIIYLDNEEKFKNIDGNIIDIETRGERNKNKIYFKVAHVSNSFNITRLQDSLINKNTLYKSILHYKYFIRGIHNNVGNVTIKNEITYVKSLYLTYKGLLRVLFTSRTGDAEKFQDWAEEKLFTIQMGSKAEKTKLGTDILNISPKTYKAVFSTYASKFPCIYLLSLGPVGLLRDTFGINPDVNNDLIVYKYGFTDDLSRRIAEHEAKYGKLPNVKMNLSTFHIIDPVYTSDAEGDLRDECNAYEVNLKVDGYKELIVLNDTQFKHIKKNYWRIGREYAGHTAELQEQIAKLREEIKDLHNEMKNRELDYKLQISQGINETEKYKTLAATNEIISNLKIKNFELQLRDQTLLKTSPF